MPLPTRTTAPDPAFSASGAIGQDATDALYSRLDALERTSGARALSVAVYDTETHASFRRDADRWFHAASTIKVAILLGVYASIHHGWLLPHSRVHVRNRFFSAADGSTFRVLSDRDANAELHAAIGKTMRVDELALHMIATSSNLATNLLLDLVGLETVQRTLDELHVDGIDVTRGVEDERALDHGIMNRVTADGLVQLLRLVAEERAFTPELSREMMELLHAQEFKRGIPARLPGAVRVAHKTGEISTIAHDAGVVYAPDRKPYVLAVLTEWSPEATGRSATIAEVSRAVFELLTHEDAGAPDAESHRFPLRIVDGLRLDKPLRDALMPGRIVLDDAGRERMLPRFFYEVQTWTQATEIRLTPGFALAEFIQTDVREAAPLRGFPRFVPCAITITALCLERFREAVGTFVHIAANGGYRSPRHAVGTTASPHSWGTAVNIYRIGDIYLDTRDAVERYAALARQELPGAWTRPFGTHRGQTTDHLHLDFGYVVSTPREAPERHLEFDLERRAS